MLGFAFLYLFIVLQPLSLWHPQMSVGITYNLLHILGYWTELMKHLRPQTALCEQNDNGGWGLAIPLYLITGWLDRLKFIWNAGGQS